MTVVIIRDHVITICKALPPAGGHVMFHLTTEGEMKVISLSQSCEVTLGAASPNYGCWVWTTCTIWWHTSKCICYPSIIAQEKLRGRTWQQRGGIWGRLSRGPLQEQDNKGGGQSARDCFHSGHARINPFLVPQVLQEPGPLPCMSYPPACGFTATTLRRHPPPSVGYPFILCSPPPGDISAPRGPGVQSSQEHHCPACFEPAQMHPAWGQRSSPWSWWSLCSLAVLLTSLPSMSAIEASNLLENQQRMRWRGSKLSAILCQLLG